MTRDDFRFLERLRVRWVEVDMQKIVFNGHYLMYFDTAVAGYWRALALPYHETMEMLQGDLFVRKASVEYLGSAHYDDLCDVGIRCSRIGTSSIVFEAGVFRGPTLLVGGELVYVFADPARQGSRPVPRELRELLQGFEARQTMLDLRVGTWDELGREAGRIRADVFADEQKIAAGLAHDAADENAVHAVAFNRLGAALATGRFVEHRPGEVKIGRMAVVASMRGGGIGKAVLQALLEAARGRGASRAVLQAQAGVEAFYARAGFGTRGEAFEEAGIRHIEMLREL